MNNLNYIKIIFFCLTIASCSSKKNIIYIQDYDLDDVVEYEYIDYTLDVDDIIKISLKIESPESSIIANSGFNNALMQTKEAMLFDGYQIDTEGYISFPSIGKIFLKGLTIREAKTLLTQRIINEKILIDPIIDIKLMNSYFTILGEVNMPGRYDFLENNLNIFEAIGYAGDLTINGKRNDIKIIRQNNIKNQIINLDLTKSDFMDNNYQIFSGDIIIVNPNNSRVKNAGIIGNSGTLLSLLSFILSSIIVISNN